MLDIENFLSSPLTSVSLIHSDTQVYDLDFSKHNKDGLLRYIQTWKNFLVKNNIKTIAVQEYLSLNLISLVYACLETSTRIYTCDKSKSSTSELSDSVDAVFVSASCADLFDHTKNNYYWIESIVNHRTVNQTYVPNTIDLDFLFVVGKTSGSTGTPKEIKHTAKTFLAAAKCCSFLYYPGQRFSSYPNINHIGMAANMVLSPTLAGATIFTVASMVDLLGLCSRRGCLDTLGLFPSQITAWAHAARMLDSEHINWFSNIDFSELEMLTGGSVLGPSVVDWFFSKNGKRIRSLYGNNEVLMPVFINDINSSEEDFFKRNLGIPCPGVEFKVDNNNNLWIKTHSISDFVSIGNDGYYNTTDLVLVEQDGVYYRGRKRINGFFMTEIHDAILDCIFEDQINLDDYSIHYNEANNQITVISTFQHVLDSLSRNTESVREVLARFNCNTELNTVKSRFDGGIKIVLPHDENLVTRRTLKDS